MNTWKGSLFGALLFLTGCGEISPITQHVELRSDMEPLRAAFNADIDKVRVVMLVAPT